MCAKRKGYIVKVEYEVESKIPLYKFDIETRDGKVWEVECSVETSRITEVEEEVKADDPRFSSQVKISEKTAIATALARHPGKVMEVEYGLESHGSATYEVDIEEDDTEEVMVEIDATTGKITGIGYENYQIGVHRF